MIEMNKGVISGIPHSHGSLGMTLEKMSFCAPSGVKNPYDATK